MALHDTRRPEPTLPADHACMVQLRKGAALTAEAIMGEVEHIVSGQRVDFQSFAESAAFMPQRVNTPPGGPS